MRGLHLLIKLLQVTNENNGRTELSSLIFCNSNEFMDLDIEHGELLVSKKAKPDIMCHLMKEHTTTYRLPKGLNLSLVNSLDQLPISKKCRGQRNTLNCSMKVQFPDCGKALVLQQKLKKPRMVCLDQIFHISSLATPECD